MKKNFLLTELNLRFMFAGKMVSDFVETKPSLKNVKDKLKKQEKTLRRIAKMFLMLQGVYLPVNFQQKTPWSKKFKIFKKIFHLESAVLNDLKKLF